MLYIFVFLVKKINFICSHYLFIHLICSFVYRVCSFVQTIFVHLFTVVVHLFGYIISPTIFVTHREIVGGHSRPLN